MSVPNYGFQFVGQAEELIESRSGSGFNSDGSRSYTRVWRVRLEKRHAKTPFAGPNGIYNCPGLPAPMAPFFLPETGENDLLALLVRYTAKKEFGDDWQCWLVTAEYSTNMPDGGPPAFIGFGADPAGAQNQPWLMPPTIKWDAETVTRARARDLDDKPYVNAAGQPLSPAPTVEVARSVLVINRNEASFSRLVATLYNFAVNSDTFLGVPPGRVRCAPIVAEQRWRGGLSFWNVSYRLVFGAPRTTTLTIPYPFPITVPLEDLEEWDEEYLNQGTMRKQNVPLVPFFGQPVPITRNGSPVTQPVLLDLNGQQAKPVGGVIQPTYVKFRNHVRRPFNPLLAGSLAGIP
jgi:hypothetical protein